VSIKTLAQRLRSLGYDVEKGAGNVNYAYCVQSELQVEMAFFSESNNDVET